MRKRNDFYFDEDFKKWERLAIAMYIFWAIAVCGSLGGVAFVVYKLMSHFGVL